MEIRFFLISVIPNELFITAPTQRILGRRKRCNTTVTVVTFEQSLFMYAFVTVLTKDRSLKEEPASNSSMGSSFNRLLVIVIRQRFTLARAI